jgi:hypothetical protein
VNTVCIAAPRPAAIAANQTIASTLKTLALAVASRSRQTRRTSERRAMRSAWSAPVIADDTPPIVGVGRGDQAAGALASAMACR